MANPSGSRAEAAYTRAVTAFQQGSFDLAKQFVTEALTVDPGHPGARALRTRIEARLSGGAAAGRAGQAAPGSGRPARSPEATSVDPTVLIDRAAHRPVDYVEPTVMIQRDDYRREDTNPPQPAPTGRPSRSAPEPTVLISSKNRPAASSAGPGSGGFFQRIKDLSGGAPPPRRPASRGPAPARQPGGFWTPTTRGAALAVGGVVIASLFVALLVVFVRWMWPSGNTLTVQRPIGGTIVGSGLQCGTQGNDCQVTRPADDTVTLQPVADSGYVFSGFTGDCAPSGRVLMTQPRSCGATFGAIGSTDAAGGGGGVMRTLTIRKPTGGTIVGEGISCGTLGSVCTTTLADGMAVALNIQTDPGFQFEQFTGDCSAEGKVTMSSSRECGASFAQPPAPIATTVRRPDPPPAPPGRRGNQGTQPPGSPATPGSGGPAGAPGAGAPGSSGTPPPASMTSPAAPVTPAPTPGLTGSVASGAGDPGQKPPTAEISAEAHAKREIDQLIKNYCAALQTMQPARLKELFPQVDVATHRELFRNYKSLKCTLAGDLEYERLDASPAGFAQVKVGMKQQFEMKTGGAPKVAELIYTLRVSRLSNSSPWMIERLQVEPKPK